MATMKYRDFSCRPGNFETTQKTSKMSSWRIRDCLVLRVKLKGDLVQWTVTSTEALPNGARRSTQSAVTVITTPVVFLHFQPRRGEFHLLLGTQKNLHHHYFIGGIVNKTVIFFHKRTRKKKTKNMGYRLLSNMGVV